MKYMGGKTSIANVILSLILSGRKPDQYYVEPFVGGCNSFDKVQEPKIGADSNRYLIKMWQAVSEGWLPKDSYTEEEYSVLKDFPDLDPVLSGYLGFVCSFGAKWFGGWARGRSVDFAAEGYRSACRQFPKLRGATFVHANYWDLKLPENSIVYCDPPYLNTTSYRNKFDHKMFWEWCREVRKNHRLFVSEFVAPEDFTCIWSDFKSSGVSSGVVMVEKLFI